MRRTQALFLQILIVQCKSCCCFCSRCMVHPAHQRDQFSAGEKDKISPFHLGVVCSVWAHFWWPLWQLSFYFWSNRAEDVVNYLCILFWVTQRFSWWTMQPLWECAQLLMHLALKKVRINRSVFPVQKVRQFIHCSPVALLLLACFCISLAMLLSALQSSLETLSTHQ